MLKSFEKEIKLVLISLSALFISLSINVLFFNDNYVKHDVSDVLILNKKTGELHKINDRIVD